MLVPVPAYDIKGKAITINVSNDSSITRDSLQRPVFLEVNGSKVEVDSKKLRAALAALEISEG